MEQQNILQLAKQGNAKAIAALMNRSLQPKGMTVVKAALKDGCFQIMLEADPAPEQQALVAFVRTAMTSLGAKSITTVKVYGQQTNEQFPTWSYEFETSSVSESAQLKPSIPPSDTSVIGPVSDSPTSTVEQVKLTNRQSCFVLLGLVVGLSVIWTSCVSLFDEDIPVAKKEQYDICMKVQMQEGDGVITADGKCDYLKRQ